MSTKLYYKIIGGFIGFVLMNLLSGFFLSPRSSFLLEVIFSLLFIGLGVFLFMQLETIKNQKFKKIFLWIILILLFGYFLFELYCFGFVLFFCQEGGFDCWWAVWRFAIAIIIIFILIILIYKQISKINKYQK